MTKEIDTAGPAEVAAASPVRTKMPVPITTPTPKTVRSNAPRRLRSAWVGSSVSAIDCSMVLVAVNWLTTCLRPGGWYAIRPGADTPPLLTACVRRVLSVPGRNRGRGRAVHPATTQADGCCIERELVSGGPILGPRLAALRRCLLAVSVLHDVDLEIVGPHVPDPRPETAGGAVRLAGPVPVTVSMARLAAVVGADDPDDAFTVGRMAGWLARRRAVAALPRPLLLESVRLVGLP